MRDRPHVKVLWGLALALVLLALFYTAATFAAVSTATTYQVTLVRGSTTVQTFPGVTLEAARLACQNEANRLARAATQTSGSVTYRCQTERWQLVASYSPNPAPVDCVVSEPTWSAPDWGTIACVNGTRTRQEVGTRTIITQPANGGTACPALTETRTATQACAVEPPPPSGYTPTKWAAPNGSATSSCTQTAPCSLTRAMAVAVAGDVVSVASGIHTAPGTGNRYAPAFNPARSGTATQPIVFFGPRTGARAELRLSSGAGPTMGTYGRTDIVLDGLTVDENFSPSVSDTGPLVVWQSDRVKLRNIGCTGKRLHRDDNHTCLRLEYVRDIEITDGVYTGTSEDGPPGQNTACVMAYDAVRVRMTGNVVSSCDVGLFIKGYHGNPQWGLDAWTVQRNRIEGAWTAIHIGSLGALSATYGRSVISDNVILSTRRDPSVGGWGVVLHVYESVTPRAITFANNTIVASDVGITSMAFGGASGTSLTDIEIRDNVIISRLALNYSVMRGTTSNYNLFSAPTIAVSGSFYTDGGTRYSSLASWQGTGLDRNSLSFDPRLSADYKLPAGSPALSGSSTGGPIGVR